MLVFGEYFQLTERTESNLQLGQVSPQRWARLPSLPRPGNFYISLHDNHLNDEAGWLTAGTGVSSAAGTVVGSSMAFSGSA